MRIFIDDLYTVRIEYEGFIEQVTIPQIKKPLVWKATEGSFQWFYSLTPIPLQEADKITVNNQTYPLQIGLVTLTELFDQTFRYDGPLGAVYHQTHTDFYVFSPVAKEMKLVLDGHMYPMQGDGTIYFVRVEGDYAFKTYYYEVRLVDKFEKVIDPYVKMTANPQGVVVPNTLHSKKTPMQKTTYEDAIIYEAHVRDMTVHLDVPHAGLFLGMTEYSDTLDGSVIDYIKALGMTHIQLLPVFDFEGVDAVYKTRFYNWGYNPKHYFALQPWFSSQPSHPETTMREFITFIDDIHQKGLGVIMDVVYNHVFDHVTYPYDKLVPGYFYRHDENHQMTDGSYCGNEVETRRYMVRKLIIDSLTHFVETYQIDGFRFDLMGLIDVETMNAIYKALSDIHPGIMIYGEGWHMGDVLEDHMKASQVNHSKMPNIAHFNDTFRNAVKGDLHGPALGYGTGGAVNKEDLILLLQGSPHVFEKPSFSINYVECHDNSTLFDKLTEDLHDEKKRKIYQRFTNALITLAEGITFFHAGQEMYRSKDGVENSYQSPDYINGLVYDLGEHIDIFKAFITYRKETKHLKTTYHVVDEGIELRRGNDLIFIKTTWNPYTYDMKSSILSLMTSPCHIKGSTVTMEDVGIYIFRKK